MHFRILQSKVKKDEQIILKVKRVILRDDGVAEILCFEVAI